MLKHVSEGISIKGFGERIGRSISYAYKILRKLEDLGIMKLEKIGRRRIVRFRSRRFEMFFDRHGQRVLDLLFLKRYIIFLRRVRGKSPEFASRVLGISYQEILRKLSILKEMGLIKVKDFIELEKEINELIDEMILLEFKKKGMYKTAFSAFQDYGVEIFDERKIYVDKMPDINEILIHSLKLMRDKRDAIFIQIFYMKNRERFDIERLLDLSTEYNVKDLLLDLFSSINFGRSKRFPRVEENREKFLEYGVKFSVNPKRKVEEFLTMLGKVTLYPIGGTYLVLKGWKPSTKDVDFLISSNDWEKIRKILEDRFIFPKKMKEKIFKVENEILVDFFIDDVFGFPIEKIKIEKEKFFGDTKIVFPEPSVIFLLKIKAGREVDLDDCKKILENSKIDFDWVLENLEEKDFFTLLDFFELYGIGGKIYRKVKRKALKILVRELLKRGKKISEIARELGISYSRVKNIANLYGRTKSKEIS